MIKVMIVMILMVIMIMVMVGVMMIKEKTITYNNDHYSCIN